MNKRMISGIKPTGNLTLGNYLGAIKPFVKYQDEYDLMVFIADLHALTLPIEPSALKYNTSMILLTYIAAGLDPYKTTIFKQSDIPYNNCLEWVLTCNTTLGEFTKMPQYKNYIESHKNQAIPTGVLMYPSLMAADILLFDAKYVPVGIDQKPHIDLARDMAEKFNSKYGKVFTLPEAVLNKESAKIMSLSDPTKKMSKSESDKGTIYLTDDMETIHKKIMKAKTDAEGKIYYDPENKPGISNLLTIYAAIKDITVDEAVEMFKDETDYGVFKKAVSKVVCDEIHKLQENIKKVAKEYNVKTLLNYGKEKVINIARMNLEAIYNRIGIL